MKKIFSFLTAILFVGSMWATEVKDTIALAGFGGSTSTVYVTTATSGTSNKGVAAVMNQWNPNSGQIRVNQGNTTSLSASNFSVYNSAAFPGAITKVEFIITSGDVTNNYCQLDTSSVAKIDSNPSYNTKHAATGSSTKSWTLAAKDNITYFRISFAKNGGTVKASYVIVTYELATTEPAVNFVDGDSKAISSFELPAAGESTSSWALAYSNIKEDSEGANPDVAVYSNAACTTEFTGDWFEAVADGANSVLYSADANETGSTRTVYVVFSNTAKNASDGDVNLTDTLTVSQSSLVLVESVSVKAATELEVGETETLTVTVLPEGASDKTVTWASSAESVATVDANGKITAVAPGTAKISATANDASGLSDTCVVTVIEALEKSTLSFTAKCSGSGKADDDVEWTIESDGEESDFDSNRGIHYGTGKKAVQYIQLSSSDITGTIKKIVVNASTANDVSATVSITVGAKAFGGDAQSLTSSATDYTFTGSAKGAIVVTITKPSSANGALYCKSIVVKYDDTTTAIDNTDASVKAVKVLREGQIFIIRGEKVYTVQGQLVK